ncbi:MAG: hypothetical protein C0501_01415 [Isosphaera sp.]|nr:hypothetical protein [Isosphaera sp.]
MSGENTRDPYTVPEPHRAAEPETAPADRPTDPHGPAPDGTVLQHGVPAVLRDPSWPTVPGYEVTGEIARGGMGAVYAARDLTLGREVAVKTVLPHLARDGRFAAEFDREAKLTAGLAHPGVPPVHALGVLADGRPFLAMKLIRGRTLADELAAADRPRLLGAFEAVCQAVGYAHAEGVVHRDLKPGNVMVGAFGEVQVMDWGLAKELANPERQRRGAPHPVADAPGSPTCATVAGQAKGTPAYMAPEQARGDWENVDARADVFALGGILCTILTGELPYRGDTVEELLRRAAAGDVAAALAKLDGCGADAELVGLCKRCLAADPAARPADGRAVAAAVAAYRAGVEERLRATERDRAAAAAEAREQRKRRKVQLALAAAVGLLLAGGGAFAWWSEKRDADQARVEGEKAKAEADRLTAARAAVGVLLRQAEDALRADRADRAEAALAEAGRRVDEGGIDEFRPRLDRARGELAVLKTLDGIDDFRFTVAAGKLPPAETLIRRWRETLAGYGVAPGTTPPGEAAGRVNGSLVRGRLLAALETWLVFTRDADVRAVLSIADPDPFRDTARAAGYKRTVLAWAFRGRAVGAQPFWFATAHGGDMSLDDGPREHLLRNAHVAQPDSFILLMTLAFAGPIGDKETADRRAGWCRAALAVRPKNVTTWDDLGSVLRVAGDLPGAVAAHREAVRLDPELAAAHYNLGAALRDGGDLPGAVASFREAIRLEPKNATSRANLGAALRAAGDLPGAVAAYREAVRLDPKLAAVHNNLGDALRAAGDLPGAVAAHREAIKLDPKHAPAHSNLGLALKDWGDLPGAVAAHREAVRLDPELAAAHYSLGVVLQAAGDLPGAVSAYREAARLDPEHALTHNNLGVALKAAGDLPEAVAAFREAVRLDPKYAPAHSNLGNALRDVGDLPGAVAAHREAVRLDPELAAAHYNLGVVLQAAGDLPGAVSAYREAARLDPKRVEAHTALGGIYGRQKKYQDAVASAREAITADPKYPDAHALLGLALLQTGDLVGARAALSEAARLDPKRWGPLLAKLPPVPVAPPPRPVDR